MELVLFGDDGEVGIIIEATIWLLEPKSESSRWRGGTEMKLDGIIKRMQGGEPTSHSKRKSRKMRE